MFDISHELNNRIMPHDLDLSDGLIGGGYYGSVKGSLAVLDVAHLNLNEYLKRQNELLRWGINRLNNCDYYKKGD